MRSAFFVTFILLSGCASQFAPIQGVRDAAPEWYEERKQEIRGDGYPSIANIPDRSQVTNPAPQLRLSREETLAALAVFQNDSRSEPPTETAAEMRAWTQRHRQRVESKIPPMDFMSEAEIAAMRARFDTARARL